MALPSKDRRQRKAQVHMAPARNKMITVLTKISRLTGWQILQLDIVLRRQAVAQELSTNNAPMMSDCSMLSGEQRLPECTTPPDECMDPSGQSPPWLPLAHRGRAVGMLETDERLGIHPNGDERSRNSS